MGIEVFYHILLALWVSFDTPHDTATNNACQLSVHGLSRNIFIKWWTLFQHFFHTFHLSESREGVTLRTLVLYNDISLNWCYQHYWFITIINIVIVLILRACLWRYKMLPDVFQCYRYSSSSSQFRNLLPVFVTRTNFPSARFVTTAI